MQCSKHVDSARDPQTRYAIYKMIIQAFDIHVYAYHLLIKS